MKNKILVMLALCCSLSASLVSCKKQTIDSNPGKVEFAFGASTLKNSALKADTISLSSLVNVIVTIEDLNGRTVKSSEKIELYNMNGSYISKPVSLPEGTYKLSGFLVTDWNNNVVYASPLKGSAKAYLVANPLPFVFTVSAGNVAKVTPEVLNAAESKPEDFGYAAFSFDVAKTFDFLVGTFVYDDVIKNFKLASSNIAIYTDTTTILTGQLAANTPLVNLYDSIGITNKITLPERYNSYKLVITKQGYKTYTQSFTKDELKLYFRSADKGPLVVVLGKIDLSNGLVAYYKFNGDVKDYSGNLHNGTINGTATFQADKKGNMNGAIDFTNNSSVSASIGRLGSMSISVWVKMPSPTTWYPTIIEYLPLNTSLYKGAFFLHVLGSIYPLQEQGKLYYSIYNDRQNNQTRDDKTTTSPIGYNMWNHLAFTYDSITRITKMYMNGVLATTGTSINSLYDQNLTQITIGRQLINNPSKPTNFAGSIDELKIYNRALTSNEILSLYQQ